MRNWHSLYEILQFPIGLLYMAMFFIGTGNLISNQAFSTLFAVTNPLVLAFAEVFIRVGSFILINFPVIFLIRLVTRKSGSSTSILSAISGYIAYLSVTMCLASQDLPGDAFSSILGLSTGNLVIVGNTGALRYPLQTGIVATVLVGLITLYCFRNSRHHSEYGFFAFISKDVWCVFKTVLYSMLAGVAVVYVWPLVYQMIQQEIKFISSDTTNPINLIFYGILDRVMSVLNLQHLLRNSFWYGANGGSWISMAGLNIVGDADIWTSQLASSSLTGMAGRFFTPYYILNMFAIPGFLWGSFSIRTDKVERRRTLMFYISVTIISLLSGSLLPVEITLLLLCPLLFVFHLAYTGLLFGVLQVMHVYLGYHTRSTYTMIALPGTLPEYLTYIVNPSLQRTLLTVLAVGAVSFVVYFLFTRFYFRHLAVDLFHTGEHKQIISGVIDAVGGVENIKMIHSSARTLVVNLYDPTRLDIRALTHLGSVRVYETRAGYAISFGAASTMIRMGIMEVMRQRIRASQ